MKFGSLPLAVLLLLCAGCITHRVDWNARLGNFNYDQAVIELGPPDNQAGLSDGRIIAEWVSRYDAGNTVVISGGYNRYPGDFGVVQTSPNTFESRLRLTFSTNRVLTAWSKN